MAQSTFHADLLSSVFPYSFRELGSTIVIPSQNEGPMQTPSSLHGADAENQAGYCQAFYLENVLPVSRGYSSVGYTKLSNGPMLEPVEHVLEVRAADNSLVQIGVMGANIFIALSDGTWKQSSVLRDPSQAPQVAVVRGVSYLWFGTFVVYTYNGFTREIELFNIPALGSTTIRGIVSGGSQLVVHDEETLYYSAVLDAQDFQPSIETGAGSTKVLALRGPIVFCVALSGDFVVYTQYNAIYARTTGNLAFPFVYQEIAGSIGAAKREHVAGNSNTGTHIVYTTAGFQQISVKGAEFIWPEFSDGIVRGILPTVNTMTDLPELIDTSALSVLMNFVADRWVCISLGTDVNLGVYTDCFVFDTNLARWGRLKVTHTCIFQWNIELREFSGDILNYQDLQTVYPYYEDMEGLTPIPLTYKDLTTLSASNAALTKNRPAMCSSLGNIVAFDVNDADIVGSTDDNGGTDATVPKLILGKYKITRNKGVVFQWLRCNKLKVGKVILHGHDYNGDFIRRKDNLKESPRHKDTWYTTLSADAISVEFQGVFTVSDLSISCGDAGGMNSYATPIKKFYRLLLSNMYPIEAYEPTSIEASHIVQEAEQIYTGEVIVPSLTDTEEVGITTALISAVQRNDLMPYPVSLVDIEEVNIATALFSASQVNTLVVIPLARIETEEVFVAHALQSGSLTVTLNFINVAGLETEEVSTTHALISGVQA